MKRENLFIYVGATIFVLLAIALGIIMYMMTDTSNDLQNNVGEVEQIAEEKATESVTSEIGKTVEEQKENNSTIIEQDNNTESSVKEENTAIETNITSEKTDNEQNVTTSDTQMVEKQEAQEITETKKEITFTKPTEGQVICEYAKENLIYSETLKEWITHTGVDIKADKTSVIKSSADGVIKSIVNDPRYGLTVVIGHDDGYETVYSNLLTAEFVVVGEEVSQGQTIGTAGNTASFESSMESHLHFEILKDGEYLDPSIYLK